jgi:uncharacterized DUF497 family protein
MPCRLRFPANFHARLIRYDDRALTSTHDDQSIASIVDARLTWWTFVHTLDLGEFEWDREKAAANYRDHGIQFNEAATVLEDESALTREDTEALDEQRFVSVGMSSDGHVLVVVFTHREPDIVRIISAWKANRRQRREYEKGRS